MRETEGGDLKGEGVEVKLKITHLSWATGARMKITLFRRRKKIGVNAKDGAKRSRDNPSHVVFEVNGDEGCSPLEPRKKKNS